MRRPGIAPGSTAWKAAMLTIIPPTLFCLILEEKSYQILSIKIIIIIWKFKYYTVFDTNPCCRHPFLREKLAFVSFFFAAWNSVYSVHKSPFNILNFRLGTLKIVKYNFYHISK